MPFLWLNVSDDPGPNSSRGLIERNAIVRSYGRPAADGPSTDWFGPYSDRAEGTPLRLIGTSKSMKPTIHRFSTRLELRIESPSK